MKERLEKALSKFEEAMVKYKTTGWCMVDCPTRKYNCWGPITWYISKTDEGRDVLAIDMAIRDIRLGWVYIDDITKIKETKNTLTIYYGDLNEYIKLEKTGSWPC